VNNYRRSGLRGIFNKEKKKVLAVWGNKQKGIWVKCPKRGPCPASPTRLFFLYHIFKVQSKWKPNKNWDLAAFFSII